MVSDRKGKAREKRARGSVAPVAPEVSVPAKPAHRAGYVALIGRPNAGKSTLLNQILGEKVSIVTPRPQTTRNRIAGIWTVAEAQAVLLDTPGLHPPRSPLNEVLVRAAEASLAEADLVVWIADFAAQVHLLERGRPVLEDEDRRIADLVRGSGVPLVLVLNKMDALDPHRALPVVDAWQELLPGVTMVPLSALTGDNVFALLDEIRQRLPEGEAFFPPDQLLDGTERFVVSEIVREKIILLTRQEIPYATAVQVESFDESEREGARPFVRIAARILVERDSQKGILIGRQGSMLKEIGTLARVEIEKLLAARVFLDLHVVVEPDWTSNRRLLRELGLEN
jgi:GTPase